MSMIDPTRKVSHEEIARAVQVSRLAAAVRDHDCFRQVIMGAKRKEQQGIYDLLAPHLAFAPWPLDNYLKNDPAVTDNNAR